MTQKQCNSKNVKGINPANIRVYENVVKELFKYEKESDDKIIDASKEYLSAVSDVYETEREILKEELKKNISDERREEIHRRLADINKEVIEASSKHDENFLKHIQQNQKEHNIKIIGSVFVLVAGGVNLAVKYQKPLLKAGKQLLSTVQKVS